LVPVSSIFPPGCKLISKEEGLEYLQSGQIVFVVMAKNSTNEPNTRISASVGLAYPRDRSTHGYLSEYVSSEDVEFTGKYAEELSREMLKSKFGFSDDMVESTNVSVSSICSGLYTTVVALAVFVL
jgi:arginine decarboxylase